MFLANKRITMFDKIPVYDARMTVDQNPGMPSLDGQVFLREPADDMTFTFTLVAYPSRIYQYLSHVNALQSHGQNRFAFVTMGSGQVCPHCGDYNPAGVAVCRNCGAITEAIDHAAYQTVEASILSDAYNWYKLAPYNRNLMRIDVDVALYTKPTLETGLLLTGGGDIKTIPMTRSIKAGHYLCQYCWTIVEKGKLCHNCGGQRIPLTEVAKIDHTCLYCGRENVVGAVVCDRCGAALKATMIRELMEGVKQ